MITEIIMLLAVVLGVASFASFIKVPSIWLRFGFATVAVIALRVASFTVFYLAGFGPASKWFFAAGCMAVFAWAAISHARDLAINSVLPALSAAAAFVATRVLGMVFDGHSDSRWILVAVHHIQNGGSLSIFTDSNIFKRGFVYPVTLALGDTDQYFTSITPFVFCALLAMAGGLGQLLLKGYSRSTVLLASGSVLLIAFSTTMLWRSVVYLNSHIFVGLLLATVVAVSMLSHQEGRLTSNLRWVLLAAVFTLGMVRSEGLLVALVALLTLLSAKFISRFDVWLLAVVPTISFTAWLTIYNSFVIQATHLPWYLFMLVLVAAVSLVALPLFDWVRHRSVKFAGWLFAAVLVVEFAISPSFMTKGFISQFQNLFLGKGYWGFLFVFLTALIALGFGKRFGVEHQVLASTTGLLILVFMAAKTLDDAAVGKLSIGRVGWGDSLNRMWIHILVLLAVLAISNLASRLEPHVANKSKS